MRKILKAKIKQLQLQPEPLLLEVLLLLLHQLAIVTCTLRRACLKNLAEVAMTTATLFLVLHLSPWSHKLCLLSHILSGVVERARNVALVLSPMLAGAVDMNSILKLCEMQVLQGLASEAQQKRDR
jgi:hypothetical protein